MDLHTLLEKALDLGGSDLFILPGSPVMVKCQGGLVPITEERMLPPDTQDLVTQCYAKAGDRDFDQLNKNGDDDFSFSLAHRARFRCNVYRQRGSLAATCRAVSFGLPDPQKLSIPERVLQLVDEHRSGLILVTGPAGSGKSTTLACMVDRINSSRTGHIITIEDPIEYLHPHKMSLVSQREIPNDTASFDRALRAALRQAPDVIMLGEMRDHETMQMAITAAETGHLVLSSLHTLGAAKTMDRIIDSFPPEQQHQIRIQLSMVMRAVISQRLIPTTTGETTPVFELMTVNPAIQNMIRDGKTHQIDNVIYSGAAAQGMLSMDNSLLQLYRAGRISKENALSYALNTELMAKRV